MRNLAAKNAKGRKVQNQRNRSDSRKDAKGAKGELVISTQRRNPSQIPHIRSGQGLARHFAFLATCHIVTPSIIFLVGGNARETL